MTRVKNIRAGMCRILSSRLDSSVFIGHRSFEFLT